jgi:hypothetical protein
MGWDGSRRAGMGWDGSSNSLPLSLWNLLFPTWFRSKSHLPQIPSPGGELKRRGSAAAGKTFFDCLPHTNQGIKFDSPRQRDRRGFAASLPLLVGQI